MPGSSLTTYTKTSTHGNYITKFSEPIGISEVLAGSVDRKPTTNCYVLATLLIRLGMLAPYDHPPG